jgi:hypothetical protein
VQVNPNSDTPSTTQSGTITFYDGTPQDAARTLGTGTLTTSGTGTTVAHLATCTPQAGSHCLHIGSSEETGLLDLPGPEPVSDRSPDLLRKLDDDPLGAADVTEPVAVLVLLQFADELCAVSPQAVEEIVDALYREGDMTDSQRVRRSARVTAWTRRRVEAGQLDPSVAVWGPQHRDVRPDSLEPDNAIHPAALDRCLAFQFEPKLDEEGHGRRKVIDDDADMVHPLNCHVGLLDMVHMFCRSVTVYPVTA